MIENNNDTIVEKKFCCACYACVNVCPVKCISMQKDSCGSLYPHINKNQCINCDNCRRICPSLNHVNCSLPKEVYAAYSKNDSTRKNSTSGGVATELSKFVIEHYQGVVYGAEINGLEAQHIRVTDLNQLSKLQGSKYVHSHIKDTYSKMKEDLAVGKKVLLIGSPCQIAGARNILNNKYSNLILVDILCHGTPSQDSFANGIKLETNSTVSNVTFRNGNKYCLTGYNDEKIVFKTPYRASYYLNGFVEGYIFRENCYFCQYAKRERCSDITIGDFWGLGKNKEYSGDIENGVNLVTLNTDTGIQLWRQIKDSFEAEPRDYSEAIQYNHPLQKPAILPKNYEKYKNVYSKSCGSKALTKAYKSKTRFIKIRRIIRKNPKIYTLCTSIPNIGKRLKDYPT